MQLLTESDFSLVPFLPVQPDTVLKGMILLGATAMTMLPLRRASADARHLAWLCGIIGLLLLPILSAFLPAWRALPAWADPTSFPTIERAKDLRLGPLPQTAARSEAQLQLSFERADERPLAAPAHPTIPEQQPTGAAIRSRHSGDWLTFAWAAGALLLGARFLLGYCRLHFASRHALSVADGSLVAALQSAAATLGLRRRVRLFVDPRRTIPLAWGVWRPRLILPAAAASWDPERSHAVFLHELAHVKRGDLLVLLLTQAACALHWFNPLVWVAARRLHIERERACDDLVLASGMKASVYAGHLLHMATQLEACAPCGSLAMARPSRLEGRLLTLLDDGTNRSTPSARVVALHVVALSMLLFPLAMLRGADEKTRDQTGQPPKPNQEAENPGASRSAPEEKGATADDRPAVDSTEHRNNLPTAPETRTGPKQSRAREIELLNREIEIVGEQVRRATKGYDEGRISVDQVMEQERELSLLKIEQAKIKNDFEALAKAIRERMELVAQRQLAQEKRVEAGVATRDSILSLEREWLRLERELATAANQATARASATVLEENRGNEQNRRTEELREAELELGLLLTRFRPAHPTVRKMQDRVDALKRRFSGQAMNARSFEPRREIAISAPKAGIVHQVLVREGDQVKVGDRLLIFDQRGAKVRLDTARAQHDAAKAGLKLAEIAVQGARAQLESKKGLGEARLTSQEEVNTHQRATEAAGATLEKARAECAVVEQQLVQAELELELLTILSPKAGKVSRVNILEGEHTAPGGDPLVVIGD